MDVETIDREYNQLEDEARQTAEALQALAAKLQAASAAGDKDASAWLADLKAITDQVQQEHLQMNALLQALHGFVKNTAQQQQQPQGMRQQVGMGLGGGMMGGFMGGGFGRAMEAGAGFSLANMLIGSIFRGL